MNSAKLIFPLLLISALCLSFFSCSKDNPVIPSDDNSLDSSRFRWKSYNIDGAGYYEGVWAKDTDNIYALNSGGFLIHLQNNTAKLIEFTDFKGSHLVSYNTNTAYILGTTRNVDSSLCRILKWNGSEFRDVPIGNNKYMYPEAGFAFSSNLIWLNNDKTQLCKFEDNNLTVYNLILPNDTNCSVQKIFFDSIAQKPRAILLTNTIVSPMDIDRLYFVYDFDGTNWNKVSEFRTPINDPNTDYVETRYINGYFLTKKYGELSIYNNGSFVPFLKSNGFEFGGGLDGYSRTNIMTAGFQPGSEYGNEYFLFHWNGKKWSKEFKTYAISEGTTYMINENFYVIVDNIGLVDRTKFTIGLKN
ncbi:MAG: hypothetical protein KBG21_06045 [Ignavibacteria bacterium]|nr:hypothetical protein [Ignavibacteria bacterium]